MATEWCTQQHKPDSHHHIYKLCTNTEEKEELEALVHKLGGSFCPDLDPRAFYVYMYMYM